MGKSRGEPCLDTRETRFAIVFILQDRDRVTLRLVLDARRGWDLVVMAINFRPEDAGQPMGKRFRDVRS